MKKGLSIICILVAAGWQVSAQTAVTRIFVKGGHEAWENYLKEVYVSPSFVEGIVEYKNGKQYKSKLNYNRAIANIQFISETNDTLALADPENVASVRFGDEVFFMNPVCLQRVAGNEKVVLAKNEKIRLADKQKVGAMGVPNSSGTIDSYDRTYSRNNPYIDINEQLLIRKTAVFYLETAEYGFTPASRKNVLQLFPDAQAAIKKFIEQQSIDFNSESDLIELTSFLSKL